MSTKVTAKAETPDQTIPLAILAIATVALVLGFGNTLYTAGTFWDDDQYSHGYLIPFFALFLLWLRFEPIKPDVPASARWGGLGLMLLGLAIWVASAYPHFVIPEMWSFIPAACGLYLMICGWPAVRWAWPALAFLVLMFPFPDRVERGAMGELKKWATAASTVSLQTLGQTVYSEGNTLFVDERDPKTGVLTDAQLGVADQCSGLRMLTVFVALGLAMAIILAGVRPWWQLLIIVASTVPIALFSNMLRIVITGLLYRYVSAEWGHGFHDQGWLMMIPALGLMFLELWILDNLFIEDEPTVPLGFGQPAAATAAKTATATATSKPRTTAPAGPGIPGIPVP